MLTTKLRIPRARADAVPRPRIAARLDSGADARLTLVAAPAGFGKTSALAGWLAWPVRPRPVAWLSLDGGDADPSVFARYLVAAIERAVPASTAPANAALEGGASLHDVVGALIGSLDAAESELVLVLDDLHLVTDATATGTDPAGAAVVLDAVELLVDRLPPGVQLVIATRADPPLPLARLRARGELVELRAADLRFTDDEASAFLTDTMGLDIRPADVAALDARAEGWIAALQLAALTVRDTTDPHAAIARFAGDDRHVVDYLVEEVLERQVAEVRDFLLATAILPRLRGDLVDAVTGRTDGAAMLDALDRGNLFVVPLDDRREWYRYHHLFAEMLRARAGDGEDARDRHRRAATWFEAHGETEDALHHLLAAQTHEAAAVVLEGLVPQLRRTRREAAIVHWVEALPTEVRRAHPRLMIALAGARLSTGRLDGVEELLAEAEQHAPAAEGSAIRGEVALYRAARALATGDLDEAQRQATVAADITAADPQLGSGPAAGILGLVRWTRGDLPGAESAWRESIDGLARSGHHADTLGGRIALGEILLTQGRLGDAIAEFRRGLEVATASEPPLRGAADMHVGLGDALRERGELAAAREQLERAEALGEFAGLPQNRHRRRVALARLRAAEGDPAGALTVLDEAAELYTPDFFPDMRPIAAERVRLLLALGRVVDARDWAARTERATGRRPAPLDEFAALQVARVHLTDPERADPDAATALLDRLDADALAGGRAGSRLRIRVLGALARQANGRAPDALEHLAETLRLSEPEGWVHVIADEGAPIARLLAALAKRRATPYLRRLLDAATTTRAADADQTGLAAPLSARELDVLRLLDSGLSGADIARELSISLNTMRSHTKSIFVKLGVTSRPAAVRRASELGLLGR